MVKRISLTDNTKKSKGYKRHFNPKKQKKRNYSSIVDSCKQKKDTKIKKTQNVNTIIKKTQNVNTIIKKFNENYFNNNIIISPMIDNIIMNEIRCLFPVPIGEIFFQETINNLLKNLTNEIYSNFHDYSVEYFNQWIKEYEQTTLAQEQQKLFDIAKGIQN